MVSKIKVGIAMAAAVLGMLAVASMVHATSALSVTCNGAVSGNAITWTAAPSGGAAPYAYLWSGDSSVAGSTSTSIVATYPSSTTATYTAGIQVTDASSTVATSTCSATVTAIVAPAPTSTTRAFAMRPSLAIGENGQFLAHGMVVTSIGTNSFQGQVWGITYTVNWSGSLTGPLEFWFRYDKAATSTPAQQLAVGDEVGVAGAVSSSSPMTVNASVVRDYSITVARPVHTDNGIGNGGEDNGIGNGNAASSGTNYGDLRSHLNDLLNQFKNLQNLFQNRFGGNGKGNDH